MRQQAIKWWKPLAIKDKENFIKQWKNSPGPAEDQLYKEWPENLIMLSTSIIEKIFVFNNIRKRNEETNNQVG